MIRAAKRDAVEADIVEAAGHGWEARRAWVQAQEAERRAIRLAVAVALVGGVNAAEN